MTLVVARIHKDRIAIASDTLVTMHGQALPMAEWTLKSICLPGNICVSYSGSPELAARAFVEFRGRFPEGVAYAETISFFEASSKTTNNDYIVAFAKAPRLVTIRSGERTQGLSKTHWIGDQYAYERFREYEYRRGHQHEQGRAINAAMFADEISESPASNLYSIMRNVALDRDIPSVGGLIAVTSNRDMGFRFSVYSDILLDWPAELAETERLALTDRLDLRATGENDRYSVNQIAAAYYNLNAVAFYLLKGRLLVAFHEVEDGRITCRTFRNVEPDQIANVLDEKLRFSFNAMCLVMSAREAFSESVQRTNPDHGLGISLYCEVNTMQKTSEPY